MSIAHWNCILPETTKIGVVNHANNLEYRIPPLGGRVVLEHVLDSTAPAAGNWLAFLPKQMLDYWVSELHIMLPQVDNAGTPTFRFRVGMLDTDLGSLRTGDGNIWAGTQQVNNATDLLVTHINGLGSGANSEFSAGCDVNGGVVSIYKQDLYNGSAPNAVAAGFSNFNIGLQVTAAAAAWRPTDASKRIMRVEMNLIPRPRRNLAA